MVEYIFRKVGKKRLSTEFFMRISENHFFRNPATVNKLHEWWVKKIGIRNGIGFSHSSLSQAGNSNLIR